MQRLRPGVLAWWYGAFLSRTRHNALVPSERTQGPRHGPHWLALAALLAAAVVGVIPGAAGAVDGAVGCTIEGGVSISPGITPTPHSNYFEFESTGIQCEGVGPDQGSWSVSATADSGPSESCAAAVGDGEFTGGSGPSSTIVGGRFTFVRTATIVVVSGEVITSDGIHHQFVAVFNFVPNEGDCVTAAVTHAQVVGGLALAAGT